MNTEGCCGQQTNKQTKQNKPKQTNKTKQKKTGFSEFVCFQPNLQQLLHFFGVCVYF
eukprot:NODE_8511_length_354_cov_13.308197_g6756_i0.p2 GENE.NODE_8511_length_354_cov_13.308197_g6756_i0~~NODE_8511_length_354_cov_13.308197_g6756_i0.p2  ORF type:complete len:57 (-),score=8.83 NODE_8511_length_354_cov_13.308197_g6756_i0:172-342(-)